MGNLDFSANADQLKELAAYMASQINVPTIGIGGGYAPIGTIISVMGTTAPQDYLACDGTVYNIADYPQLADYFESQFGESNHFGGNGTTTFAVPDLQGEFLRGTGTNSHANQGSGANVGEHQDGTVHLSCYNDSMHLIAPTDSLLVNTDTKSMGVGNRCWIGNSGSDNNANTYTSRPTNTSVLYCIKAVVAGFVYSTEERVGGTWIDGKKWYYKTINFGALPNATQKAVAHGISNLDYVISLDGVAENTNGNSRLKLPFPGVNNVNEGISLNIAGVSPDKVSVTTGQDRTAWDKTYITIRYTKTTD